MKPFSALDYQTRLRVADEIHSILRREGKTAILVTHDISEAISMSDRVLVFSSRPATLKHEHSIHLSGDNTPLGRRNAPEFKDYFDMIWKELDSYEKNRLPHNCSKEHAEYLQAILRRERFISITRYFDFDRIHCTVGSVCTHGHH